MDEKLGLLESLNLLMITSRSFRAFLQFAGLIGCRLKGIDRFNRRLAQLGTAIKLERR
jgi:hypothetical protein